MICKQKRFAFRFCQREGVPSEFVTKETYIATRSHAERLGDHGLFGDENGVDLDKAMSELEHCTGNVWTHIISLQRDDAERLG